MIKKPKKLLFAILISQFAGLVGSFFTTPSIPTWYANLNKPVFSPPNWIFGPVWVTLYTLMGISIYLIWMSNHKSSKHITRIFYAHLLLNSLWSIIFFGLKRPDIAFFEISILWFFIVYLIEEFKRINKTASILMIPYLLWVTFAGFLNYAIWQLN